MYDMSKNKIIIIICILAVIIFAGVVFSNHLFKAREPMSEIFQPKISVTIPDKNIPPKNIQEENTQPITTPVAIENNNQAPTILSEVNLNIPFQPQAPFADWAEPYQDACEEASIIMVDHYLRGVGLSKQEMKDEIDQMVAWQTQKWDWHKNLTVEEVKIVAAEFYKYKTEIITDLTIKKIKTQLSLGRPVVVPATGRDLGNPYYTPPGPIYHMLVIKGYDANGNFITNDPGTKRGADYSYNESVLLPAIRDWDGTNAAGPRVGLIMYK